MKKLDSSPKIEILKMENTMDQTFEDAMVNETMEYGMDNQITPSLLESDLDSSRNPENRKNRKIRKCCICLLILLVLIYFITNYWHSHSKQIATKFFDVVHKLVNANTWYSYTIFFLIEFMFSWLLIPGATYFDIALAYFMKDFWRPFWIIFLGPMVAAWISFFSIRYCFRGFIERKFGRKKLFKAIKYEVDK
jgi:hypothetical protein